MGRISAIPGYFTALRYLPVSDDPGAIYGAIWLPNAPAVCVTIWIPHDDLDTP